jgi:hypothetical protein
MKVRLAWLTCAVIGFGALSVVQTTKAAEESSTISAFAGRYSATATINTGASSVASQSASGSFKASKRKENGTMNLSSTYSAGGPPLTVQETYQFRKRSFSYVLIIGGQPLSGGGNARISKRKISYSGTVSGSGASASIAGTVRRTTKRLIVSNQIANQFVVLNFSYNLKRRGR